jgi:hypothetical protein
MEKILDRPLSILVAVIGGYLYRSCVVEIFPEEQKRHLSKRSNPEDNHPL